MSKHNPIKSDLLWWAIGLAAGTATVVGVSLLAHNAQATTAGTPGSSNPIVTLSAGSQQTTISSSQSLTLQAPSGGTISSATAEDGTQGSISGGNAFFNSLSVGSHTVTVSWTDASNTTQTTTVAVTVTQ